MLDIYKLEIFALVAQTGSFTKAAEALYMSQSAVSQHIKTLEDGLGTRLFARSRGGARLTLAGETLFEYAQQILRLAAMAENAVTNVENLTKGQLRLGATPVAGGYLLPDWIRTFRRQYPNLRVSLQTDATLPTIESLLSRRLDIAFIEGELTETAHLSTLALQEIDLFLIVGKHHPWRDREMVSVRELDGQPLAARLPHSHTRQWLERFFSRHGVAPDVMMEFDDPETIKRLVIRGQCATFLPLCMVAEELAQGELAALRVPEMRQKQVLKLVWNNLWPFTPISRAFLTSLTNTYPQLQTLAVD
ncbi:MAG: LysR family transcriptional regulator [Chloroflexi bacterium]|nr:LysR family transcriptional regulator [Chloroflexota bacterium]